MKYIEGDVWKIGQVGNFYGCLSVKRCEGLCYWSIEDWDGEEWEEIPESLFNELIEFDKRKTI